MRRIWTRTLLALALVAAAPVAAAHAEPPVDLDGVYVLDTTSTLTATEIAAVERAADDLFASTGSALFVVLVDRFESPSDGPDWANESAQESTLGGDDVLLAIAIDEREIAYSVDSGFPLSNDRIDDVIDETLIPALRDDRWADGIVAFAEGLDEALQPGPPWLAIIAGAAGAGLVGWGATSWGRRRYRTAKAARDEREAVDALDAEADALLVELDDSLKTSEQELGFAAAQFGEDATAEFRAALRDATSLVTRAFANQRALDDDTPETPVERRALVEEILVLCRQADAALDAQAAAFDDLRALEREAPRLREELAAKLDTTTAAIDRARATEADVRSRYGAAAAASVDGSVAQTERLAAFASVELERAEESLRTGATGVAAVRVRSAQQALGQVDELVAGVKTLARSLTDAAARLNEAVADARSDIDAARALSFDDAGDAGELTAAATAAEREITAAGELPPDVALAAVVRADAALAAVAERVTGRALQRDRAVAQLPRVTAVARDAVSRTKAYIELRRGVIGPRARTQSAAAETKYAAALAYAAADDPITALGAADEASRLAADALRTARRDVERDDPLPPRYDGASSGAFLGGILDGLFGDDGWSSGSGSSSSSRSGWSSSSRSSWSSSSSRSRSSSSSSRSSSSSSSSSSRRSGGSSSSSRRSGGRRF